MKRVFQTILVTAGLFVILTTLLPFINTNAWWIRGWDYPRQQILILSIATLVPLCFIVNWRNSTHWLFVMSVLIAAVFQAYRIAPYTPVWPVEIADVTEFDDSRCVSVFIANVLMHNRNVEAVREQIRSVDPDVVLLMENNLWWSEALSDVKSDYTYIKDHPRTDTYGMLFMTRLQVSDAEIRFLVSDDIPSIKASLILDSGETFDFYGLHPEPPMVGKDTDQRDAELIVAAREVRESQRDAIVAGDLNDVAWSHTTRLFQRISRTLDPRIGRGMYASFHADYWFARWPLDHIFVTPRFVLKELFLSPHVGSDHFPVVTRLCFEDAAQVRNAEPEDIKGNDVQEMEESIIEGSDEDAS